MTRVEPLTREQRRKHTRGKLLDADQRLFAACGLGASLDEVAAGAGLTKGAVYANVANKEAEALDRELPAKDVATLDLGVEQLVDVPGKPNGRALNNRPQ